MSDEQIEALARKLWALHAEALGQKDFSLWTEELTSIEREAWIQVTEFVTSIVEGAIANTLITYGYNGKREYKGLDELIKYPDHR